MADYMQFLSENRLNGRQILDSSVFKKRIRTKFWFFTHPYWFQYIFCSSDVK